MIMRQSYVWVIPVALLVAFGIWNLVDYTPQASDEEAVTFLPAAASPNEAAPMSALPRLLELGSDRCIPCQKMAPILEELKVKFAGQLQVDFIDVWQHPDEAPKYKIETIPTQIFFDAQGRELFRHVGFFAKDDILHQWQQLGYYFNGTGDTP
jgi:thioredoxin 1